MSQQEDDLKMVDEALQKLSEHFDTVQIFCTRHEQNSVGTTSVQLGSGNWFARYGQVASWMSKQDEGSRIEERQRDKT